MLTYSHKAGREMSDEVVLEVPSRQENLFHLLIKCNLVEEREREGCSKCINVLDCVSVEGTNV